ncbi:MAG TPA: DUF5666 domain-containing protein [Dehalococcoidia bacterium]|jgi:hypothetical protein
MVLNKRVVIIAVAACGVAIGIAFGVGVAYGRGDPKTVESGLSQQEIAALLGGGLQSVGSNNATGQRSPGNAGGGLLGNNTIGQVTAVDGRTVTVKTAQAEVKVTLDASTKVSKYGTTGSDLQVGDTVVVAGTRQQDGSMLATSVSQMPSELATLASGLPGGGRFGGAATPTP